MNTTKIFLDDERVFVDHLLTKKTGRQTGLQLLYRHDDTALASVQTQRAWQFYVDGARKREQFK